MQDIQNSLDERGIPIQRVGVKDIHLPFQLLMKDGSFQHIHATCAVTIDLASELRGTHMSRFVEVLHDWSQRPLAEPEIQSILQEVTDRQQSKEAHFTMAFKCFLPKSAPVSDRTSLLDYDCAFEGALSGDTFTFVLGLQVPFTSLCPCSKAISRYGAHNQRGWIRVRVRCRPDEFIWIEDLVTLLEGQSSAPIYPLIKREDEKYLTEQAYENPKFVEDVLRDVVQALRQHPAVVWFEAEVESHESIHNHSAFAAHREEK